MALPPDLAEPPPPWTVAERVGFRFLFAYFALYFFPLPTGLADPEWLSGVFDGVWHRVVPWFAARALHVTITSFSTGSGDTTYDYVRVLLMAGIAVAATLVWSTLDRRRPDYRALHAWARLWLRYALALSMVTYGMVKVVKLQFPTPSYSRLTETFGEASPMGLLWTFMGYSTAYSFYAGMGELLGAFLLFARRTATLGALVVAAVMSNVVVLNFSYDVPVKLGSCHLLAAALFIAAPDAGRLVDFFVRNRPTAPGSLGPQVERTWLRRGGVALSVLVIGYALASEAWNARQAYVGRTAPAPYGSYSVETLTLDGKEVTSASSPHEAWQTILLATAYVRVWRADRSTLQVGTRGDLTRGPVSLFAVEGTVPMAERPATGELRLEPGPETRARLTGTVEGRAVDATIVRHDPGEFPLMQRGFHWISENPFNR